MNHQSATYHDLVKVSHSRELENALDRAVENAILQGYNNPGCGIMVTRHDHRTFTVELSPDVPYGTIFEQLRFGPDPRQQREAGSWQPQETTHVQVGI
ncbi:hypothetical protein [Paenarthrobacter nitroguajacolicus]